MINEYIDAGLISFEQMDDTPVTLKHCCLIDSVIMLICH